MDASMSTPATSASISRTSYCGPCKIPFAGKKEYDRHMKHAKAHNPSGVICYYPGCSKTYQKWESLHTHVGRDHRDEIEALAWENWARKEIWASQQHGASGSNSTSFLTGTQNIVEESHAGFHQMAYNTPISPDATISTAHEMGISMNSTAFAGPQHMFEDPSLHTAGTNAQQTLAHNMALSPYTVNASYGSNREMNVSQPWPYTTTYSALGMSTASSLPPSTSQLGTSSTPAGTLDHIYPTLGMLPTSVSSYVGHTGRFGDNYQGQEALAMGAASSGPYMGSPDTMLDDDAEISHDDYI